MSLSRAGHAANPSRERKGWKRNDAAPAPEHAACVPHPSPCLLRRGMPTIFLHLGIFRPALLGNFQPAKVGVNAGLEFPKSKAPATRRIPVYDMMEKYGVKPCLVDAHGMKNVPGRRTDWPECQWIQFLHSVGLLRGAFRPDGEVGAVGSLMRHRNAP